MHHPHASVAVGNAIADKLLQFIFGVVFPVPMQVEGSSGRRAPAPQFAEHAERNVITFKQQFFASLQVSNVGRQLQRLLQRGALVRRALSSLGFGFWVVRLMAFFTGQRCSVTHGLAE